MNFLTNLFKIPTIQITWVIVGNWATWRRLQLLFSDSNTSNRQMVRRTKGTEMKQMQKKEQTMKTENKRMQKWKVSEPENEKRRNQQSEELAKVEVKLRFRAHTYVMEQISFKKPNIFDRCYPESCRLNVIIVHFYQNSKEISDFIRPTKQRNPTIWPKTLFRLRNNTLIAERTFIFQRV